MQTVKGGMPWQGTSGQPITRPNYILQDKDDNKSTHRYHTRSQTTSIMQEAMLPCINITKPKFKISAAKLATRKLTLIWLCKVANSVIGKQGELHEYWHLIAYPKTWATWPLLRQRAQMAGTRNAGLSDWKEHNSLHPKGHGTASKGKGRHVRPHHLPHQAGEIR
jgi:hypothetical protein